MTSLLAVPVLDAVSSSAVDPVAGKRWRCLINVWSFPPHFDVAVWLGAGLQPGIGNVVADGLFATAQAIAKGAGFIVPG